MFLFDFITIATARACATSKKAYEKFMGDFSKTKPKEEETSAMIIIAEQKPSSNRNVNVEGVAFDGQNDEILVSIDNEDNEYDL